MKNEELFREDNEATYCPEDNKLRLYAGRVPREEYLALRKEGWTSTPKQECDFVATWSCRREDTALSYTGGILEDEDQSPQDRAADRAERFAGYRENRTQEATGHADSYEAGPLLHGHQSQALAERRANQHDRIATRAVNQWQKAEYWQRRTAGVIGNALYKSAPGVRMGRIKVIEADLRKEEKGIKEYCDRFQLWQDVANETDKDLQDALAKKLAYITHGDYTHPRTGQTTYLYALSKGCPGFNPLVNGGDYRGTVCCICGETEDEHDDNDPLNGAELAALWLEGRSEPETESRYSRHLKLRLAYENQMLEAQGGRAAHIEMIPGGWLGNKQIQKVNISPATGRVVSVQIWGESNLYTKESGYTERDTKPCLLRIKTERLASDTYRAPTDEELAAFKAEKKAKKAAKPKTPRINPTPEAAERLQKHFNDEAAKMDKGRNYPRKPSTAEEMTQARFSSIYKEGKAIITYNGVNLRVRTCGWQRVDSVVVLTDKPQKPLPDSVFQTAEEKESAAA